MAPIDYLVLRVVRHHLPSGVVHRLLRRGIIIRPGTETRDPATAFLRFKSTIEGAGDKVVGKRILIFGYGGRTAVGAQLLQAGAEQVVLLDPYVNAESAEIAGRLTLVHQPLDLYLAEGGATVDLVLSNSVLEHVADMESTVRNLARVTRPEGQQFHFIDLRDHFFKYPFEMLCYSASTWRRFLNPGSNLNRLRIWDYERLFSAWFQQVAVTVRERLPEAFRAARPRIRPEFLSGDEARDSATQILLQAGRRYSGGR